MRTCTPWNAAKLSIALCLGFTLNTALSGCGTLIGNVKPVAEKSEDYKVEDLSKTDRDWIRMEESKEEKADHENSDISDLAYQSKTTQSIISLNSGCRQSVENQDLRRYTQQLLLGISDITLREEQNLTVDNTPALQTTIRGTLKDEPVMIRAVVIRKNQCLYDVMYFARPDLFSKQEQVFSRFVGSLKLK